MKVYVNKRLGGMLLVAANSPEEAHRTLHADESYAWAWHKQNGEIVDDFYFPDRWKELKDFHCDTNVPHVIDGE